MVARFEHRKGHAVLVEAIRRLPADGPPIVVVFAGDGPERSMTTDSVTRAGLSDKTRFVTGENVWNLYAIADVLVLPSIVNEDFPIVILEAMASSLPVVATAVAGIPEQVVHGETGYVLQPGDADALASALQNLVADEAARRAMGIAGRTRFEREFSAPRAIDRYRELYAELGVA